MTSPHNAETTDDGRFYTWPPTEERFMSITTHIKAGVPKPHLIGWAQKKCGEFSVENIGLLAALKERSRGI